jgi:hypothetical protein
MQDIAREEGLALVIPAEGMFVYPAISQTAGFAALQERVTSLEEDMSKVKQKMDEFDKRLPSVAPSVSLPPRKREEIKAAMLRLLEGNNVLDYVDIRQQVDVSLLAVVDICDELEKEGKIVPVAE